MTISDPYESYLWLIKNWKLEFHVWYTIIIFILTKFRSGNSILTIFGGYDVIIYYSRLIFLAFVHRKSADGGLFSSFWPDLPLYLVRVLPFELNCFCSKIIKMMHSEFIFGFRMSKNPKIRYFIPKNGQNTLWKFSANQKLALGLGFVWPFPFDMVFLLVPKALACFLFFLLPIFLFIVEQYEEKMNEKMFLTVSRDSSTDKQQRLMWSLSDSTLSDKRVQNQNSNHIFSNETRRSNFDLMSISWPSDRVLWELMHVIHAFLH